MFFEKVCMFFKKYICFLKKYVCFLKKYIFFEKAYIFFVRLLLVHRTRPSRLVKITKDVRQNLGFSNYSPSLFEFQKPLLSLDVRIFQLIFLRLLLIPSPARCHVT